MATHSSILDWRIPWSLLVVLGFLLFHVASTSGLYTWSLTQARFPK